MAQYERLRSENEELLAEHDVLVSAYQKLQTENAELEHEHQVGLRVCCKLQECTFLDLTH